jgi:hypothetical protein
VEWALQANEEPQLGSDQVQGWVALADTAAFLGGFERAHEIARKIRDHCFKGEALGLIAYREVIAGRRSQTLVWASQLQDVEERSAALVGVGEAMVDLLKKRRE